MRKECFKISGTRGSIDENALEETVLNLFSKLIDWLIKIVARHIGQVKDIRELSWMSHEIMRF